MQIWSQKSNTSITVTESIRALFCDAGEKLNARARQIAADPFALFDPTRNIGKKELNQWFAKMRVIGVFLLISGATILNRLGELDMRSLKAVILIALSYVTLNLFWLSFTKISKITGFILHIQLAIDLVVFTVIAYFFGNAYSELAYLYLLNIIAASFISGFASAGSMLTTVALYAFILYFAGPGTSFGSNTEINIHIVSYGLIAAAVAVQSNFFVSRLRKKEEDAVKLKDAFLGMAMHQIRNPLATETILLETVEIEGKDRMLPEHLQTIRQAKKMNENVAQFIKDFSVILKTEEHLDKLSFEEISPFQVLREIIREIRLVPSKKVTVMCDFIEKYEALRISTIPSFFRQIFLNIISNAVLYSHYHGRVIVSAERSGNALVFKCTDDGIGIPDEDGKNIFDPFFRGSNAKKKEEGTGLGLFIVKRFADLLGYRVWFESSQGKGTSFFISIPLGAGAR